MFEKEHLKFEVLNQLSQCFLACRDLEYELHCAVIQLVSAQPQRSHGIHQLLSASKKKANIYNRFTPCTIWLGLFNIYSHGKSPFLRTANHLFRLGPWLNHGYVSHNQMVKPSGFYNREIHRQNPGMS